MHQSESYRCLATGLLFLGRHAWIMHLLFASPNAKSNARSHVKAFLARVFNLFASSFCRLALSIMPLPRLCPDVHGSLHDSREPGRDWLRRAHDQVRQNALHPHAGRSALPYGTGNRAGGAVAQSGKPAAPLAPVPAAAQRIPRRQVGGRRGRGRGRRVDLARRQHTAGSTIGSVAPNLRNGGAASARIDSLRQSLRTALSSRTAAAATPGHRRRDDRRRDRRCDLRPARPAAKARISIGGRASPNGDAAHVATSTSATCTSEKFGSPAITFHIGGQTWIASPLIGQDGTSPPEQWAHTRSSQALLKHLLRNGGAHILTAEATDRRARSPDRSTQPPFGHSSSGSQRGSSLVAPSPQAPGTKVPRRSERMRASGAPEDEPDWGGSDSDSSSSPALPSRSSITTTETADAQLFDERHL